MDKKVALEALAALGHETRLDVFRLLIRMGEQGLLAGEIARELDVRQNTLSTNLSILLQAGLLNSVREGRAIRYYADMEGVRGLLMYLMEDCCGGVPSRCRPIIDDLAYGC